MGLKKNILYSGFLTTSLYIFQFITYPYVARVLGVTNIGICNYVQSIVQYFCLFSMLGISTLGVREIAKCNGDKLKLNQTFSQLFTLNAVFTVIVLAIYFLLIEIIPNFNQYRKLLYIGATQIFFGTFAVEWLFRGLEEFKYITVRTLFVRLAYVISVFVFVRTSNDYTIYFLIYSAMVIANGIINWSYGKRFVRFSLQSISLIRPYVKPLIFLGSQLILTSLYTTFNTVYLGMTCGDTEVGYYTTATKIENIVLALYSSFTLVMMPRISSLMQSERQDDIKRLLQSSFNLLFAFVFPCIFFSEFYAHELVYLVAGNGYEGAVLPMRIVMPLMLVVGLEQILIVQILMPSRSDKQVFVNSIIGAVCSILLNVLLVSKFESIGSSIVWFVSELAVMTTALYFVKQKYFDIVFFTNMVRHLLSFIPMLSIYYFIYRIVEQSWVCFSLGFIFTLIYCHFVLLYIVKNDVYITFKKLLISKYIKR
ncbi:MAG: putative O-antigen transporter [Bacteroidetes bacterium ADurb.Bin302]|nr:MAG: putative O-antigen transporter [Bacteroidetes bacterium ADurb.Bin302]